MQRGLTASSDIGEMWKEYKTFMCKHGSYCDKVFLFAVSLCHNVSFGVFTVKTYMSDCPVLAAKFDCYDDLKPAHGSVPDTADEHICILNTVCQTPSQHLSHYKFFTIEKKGKDLDTWWQAGRDGANPEIQVRSCVVGWC